MARVVRIQSRICVGGPALHSILLSEGLSYARGARYDTVLMGGALEPGESSMEPFARERGVAVEIVSQMRRPVQPWADAQAVASVVARLRQIRPQIVHTHTAKAGAVGRSAAILAQVPVVVHTFHGHVFEGYFNPTKAKVFVAVERALARSTDVILAISQAQRRDLVERYRIAPAHKVRVLPLGLELDRFRDVDRAQRSGFRSSIGLSADTPLVVAAGRLVPIKRFDVLLAAFAEVLREVPNAHLAIAGDGAPEDKKPLEQQALALGDRVHWLGWRKDLDRLYADADVLALTSDNEGTPVAVIEALSAGLPVVCTQVGGVEDVVTSPVFGDLVPPGNVSAVARALIERLRRPQALPSSERDQIVLRFSHRRLIADMASLYDTLLEEKRSRGSAQVQAPIADVSGGAHPC